MILRLILAFLKIGAFSFGGGYAVLTLMQKEIIENSAWISVKDFADIIAIAEMTPGPIAVNASTFVGYKLAGVLGSAAATISVVLIPTILALIVSVSFEKFKHLKQVNWVLKGIRPAVLGLIAYACFKIGKVSFVDFKSVLIGAAIFIGVYKYKLNPILAIVISGGLGILLYGLMGQLF